jgi:GH15 family glucan-1,4-alpha-glucosidase
LSGQRIASRSACGADIKFRIGSTGRSVLIITFGKSRERIIENVVRARARPAPSQTVEQAAPDLLQQSANIIRLLTNRDTGGVLAGPPLPVDIPSEPGYASVWARDAAYTLLGYLASGDFAPVRHFLDFAFRVQCPEGIWMHRHHSDYSVGSSWGLHQLDETGSVLHLLDAYCTQSGDWSAAEDHWDGVYRAAEFLVSSIGPDDLPIASVDLWEELESKSPYTTASVIGGLRSAVNIARHLTGLTSERISTWSQTSDKVLDKLLETMWSTDLDRFYRGIQCRAALDLSDDDTRPPISLEITNPVDQANGFHPPETPLVSLPNSTASGASRQEHDTGLDVSVLGLVFPFGVLSPNDPRIVSTFAQLRAGLWNSGAGGYGRYEGDTYGGGNSWPVATLWIACCLTAMGDTSEAQKLLDWVGEHTGPNNMVAEQVHKTTGEPLAALPMAWSHGMIMTTQAAIQGKRVWETGASVVM